MTNDLLFGFPKEIPQGCRPEVNPKTDWQSQAKDKRTEVDLAKCHHGSNRLTGNAVTEYHNPWGHGAGTFTGSLALEVIKEHSPGKVVAFSFL